jgi:AcrR family transcriptional regulator
MTSTVDRRVDRPDKFEERRRELADAALRTLSELGQARTSLREIAQESAFSDGVLHYYFRDEVELTTYCVRRYKAVCARRYDAVVDAATTAPALADGFADAMADTLVADAAAHRLWYDLRARALFEESFRTDVLEIDGLLERMVHRVAARYADLAGGTLVGPPDAVYALFDGLFQQALLRRIAGQDRAADDLRDRVRRLLVALVG